MWICHPFLSSFYLYHSQSSPGYFTYVNTYAEREDTGRYTITLNNPQGSDKCTVRVTVVGKWYQVRLIKVNELNGVWAEIIRLICTYQVIKRHINYVSTFRIIPILTTETFSMLNPNKFGFLSQRKLYFRSK